MSSTTQIDGGTRAGNVGLIKIVAAREITQQLRNKGFWSSVIATALMVCLSFGLTTILDKDTERRTVAVCSSQPALASALAPLAKVKRYSNTAAAREAVRDGNADAALIDNEIVVMRKLPSDLGISLQETYRTVSYQERLLRRGAGGDELVITPLRVTALDPNAARVQQRTITAALAVFALIMLMLVSGLGIAQGVAEEKSSRIVEVLLAKVQAWHLLIGKIAGLGVAALVQISVIMVTALGVAIGFGIIDAPIEVIGTALNVLLWFIPGYVLFVTLYAVAGSLVSRQEDINHVTGPVNMLQMLSLIGPALAVTSIDRSLVAVVSMIPGLSWAAMPVRMAYSSVPAWQIVTAVVLMLLAVVALLRFGSRIYTGGLLQYGGVIKVRQALHGAKS